MVSLEDFHLDYLQTVLSDSESRGLMTPQAFFENVCEDLVSIGDLTTNYSVAEYTKRGLEVYGYDFDEERCIFTLIAHHFFQDDQIQTLTINHINTKFNRLKTFYTRCIEGLYRDIEETSEAYSMAFNIFYHHQKSQIDKVRLMVLTDGKATRNLLELPSEEIEGIKFEYRVVDIDYLYKLSVAMNGSTEFSIDVDLPCLATSIQTNEYKSYLTVVPGPLLFEIYDKFGQKLFEQNVRTFLQFKGSVNKGIRNTIEYKPHMFFAYNNGITATARDVIVDETGRIKKIINFQIVNGAQTTSSIYAACKNFKLDVSDVSLQMKLSVVKDVDHQNDFVSKVSEYANTQNKVNKSDFFSNSPYHRELKDCSTRIWAPVLSGSQKRTKWYYERVRGEYLNEMANRSKAEGKQFQIEHPKKQVIDKTFVSKIEMAWLQRPDVVSRGAQYSFSIFADYISDVMEKNPLLVTEGYFKDVVSRAILFRDTEKAVSLAKWYDGGFRAQVVAYTIAYLSYWIENRKKHLDFSVLWERQYTPESLLNAIRVIAEAIYTDITNPPEGSANISQWCKKNECWKRVKALVIEVDIDERLLFDRSELNEMVREEKKLKRIDNGIEIQKLIYETNCETWKVLHNHYQRHINEVRFSATQMDILNKIANGRLTAPSEKQSKLLYLILQRAEEDGII